MQGDFSRFMLEPPGPWTRVLFQQGKIQLDADHNNQAAVFLALFRRLARDLIGEHGGPAKSAGFGVSVQQGRFVIGEGRYWVDGWQIENGAPKPLRDLLLPEERGELDAIANGTMGGSVWVDVWERLVTAT